MYLPKHFANTDQINIKKLIEQNSFATILSFPENEKTFINHLPIIFKQGSENILIGHMAKKNPQWTHFQSNSKATVLIHGPHTYVTPKWYRSGNDVPTWNYAVAHLHGEIELVHEYDQQIEILKELSSFYESSNSNPWNFEIPDDLLDESAMTSAIISFKFHIKKSEAKFKLSQNRSQADKAGIVEGLSSRSDDMSKAVKNMMLEHSGISIWQPPVLETDRLILRPIEISDAESIYSYAKNPNVSQYTLWEAHQSVQDSEDYIRNYIFDYYSKNVPEPFGITLKDNPKKVIGTVGCFWVSKSAKSMELAYAIAEEHWGKGLVAEASAAVMNYCFQEYSLRRIQARCKAENKASARVMEKIGMSYEGTLKSAIFHRNKYWDMCYYAKIAD